MEDDDYSATEEFVEENADDCDEDLSEIAFRLAVSGGHKEYVADHVDDVELNDGDGCSTYLYDAPDSEMEELLIDAGASTVVAVVSGAGFCTGHSSTDGAVVSVFVLSMTGSVSFGVDSVVSSGAVVSATVVSAVGSVCIVDKVSVGFTAEHALIRSASSRMTIFFMAFASLHVYGSEKRKKTPMCKNRICRFDEDGIL